MRKGSRPPTDRAVFNPTTKLKVVSCRGNYYARGTSFSQDVWCRNRQHCDVMTTSNFKLVLASSTEQPVRRASVLETIPGSSSSTKLCTTPRHSSIPHSPFQEPDDHHSFPSK